MALKSLINFLNEEKPVKQYYGQIDTYQAAVKALNYLVYCARNKKNITYKILAQHSGIPQEYIVHHQLSKISARILDAIHYYCLAYGLPPLAVLCVKASTGWPSPEGVESITREYVQKYPNLHNKSFEQIISYVRDEISKYNWKPVMAKNKLSENLPDEVKDELYDQISLEVIETIKTEAKKEVREEQEIAGITTIRNTSRCGAVLLFIMGLFILAYSMFGDWFLCGYMGHQAACLTTKSEYIFSLAWLLWIPMCLLLWNASNLILIIKKDFFDKSSFRNRD